MPRARSRESDDVAGTVGESDFLRVFTQELGALVRLERAEKRGTLVERVDRPLVVGVQDESRLLRNRDREAHRDERGVAVLVRERLGRRARLVRLDVPLRERHRLAREAAQGRDDVEELAGILVDRGRELEQRLLFLALDREALESRGFELPRRVVLEKLQELGIDPAADVHVLLLAVARRVVRRLEREDFHLPPVRRAVLGEANLSQNAGPG